MLHVINSRALTGEKPCINKAIHALLMHGYATFNMLVLGPQNRCRHDMCIACPRTSKVRGNYVRETSVKRWNKIVQEITRNVAKVFSFYAIIVIEHVFFNALTFARSLGRCWKPRPSASVFDTSHGTWRMLMHEKPCLIPILSIFSFDDENLMWIRLYQFLTFSNLLRIYYPRCAHLNSLPYLS